MPNLPLHITIVDPSGHKNWTLTGRAAVLVTMVLAHRERVNAVTLGCIEFHCERGGNVQMFVREKMEAA